MKDDAVGSKRKTTVIKHEESSSHQQKRPKQNEEDKLDELLNASLPDSIEKKLQEKKFTYLFKKINDLGKGARGNDPRVKLCKLWDEIRKDDKKTPSGKTGKTRSQTVDLLTGTELVTT
jgi:hypothetical protein